MNVMDKIDCRRTKLHIKIDCGRNKLHIKAAALLAVCLTVLPIASSAQESASFLRNPVDARTLSLSGAGVVSMDDVSVLDNAALSPFSREKFSASVTAMSWMRGAMDGLGSYSASLRYSTRRAGTFFAGYRSLQTPPFELTDDYGNVTGSSSSPMDLAVEAGYAYPFLRDFAVSASVRYLRLNPGYGTPVNTFSVDAGLGYSHQFSSSCPVTDVAAIAQLNNFGPSADYGFGPRNLPWIVNVGASVGFRAGESHRFRAGGALDVSVAPSYKTSGDGESDSAALTASRGVSASFGAEYSFRKMVYVRGGYHLESNGGQNYGSIGLGFKYWHFTIDGAYVFAPSSSLLHNTAAGTLSFWF